MEPDWDGSGGGEETRPWETGPGGALGEVTVAGKDEGALAVAAAGAGGCEAGSAGIDGGIEGGWLWLGGCAGPGIPISVRFISERAAFCAVGTFDAEAGGGGGAAGTADVRPVLFLPRPSKISRSEPLLLSSDIRVS
jgi:hypothetical protein